MPLVKIGGSRLSLDIVRMRRDLISRFLAPRYRSSELLVNRWRKRNFESYRQLMVPRLLIGLCP